MPGSVTPGPPEGEQPAGEQPKRRPFTGWRFVLGALFVALVLSAVVRATLVDIYYIPSDSMQPLLQDGDRVLVSRIAGEPERGDVVVFDGRGSFDPTGRGSVGETLAEFGRWLGVAGSDTVYVKRVVGVGGDVVSCCAEPGGPVTVNGNPLEEPYVFPTDAPSDLQFEVEVPQGKLWVMGDLRSESFDSRSLLGAPGGGLVSVDRVIGSPVRIIWPPARFEPIAASPRSTDNR